MYKEKLVELLKTVPEIKKDLEELRFGCRVKDTAWETGFGTIGGLHGPDILLIHRDNELDKFYLERRKDVEDWEIIGCPLEERFIRMYCEENDIRFSIYTNYYQPDIGKNNSIIFIEGEPICQLDNTKDFSKQTEEVYKKIFLALNGITIIGNINY